MMASVSAPAFNTSSIPEVDQYIYTLNTKAHWNFGSVSVTQIVKADMDHDSVPEIVVMYVTRGATWTMINVAVFSKQNNKYVLVDDEQLRAAEASRFEITNGILTVNLTQWGDDDPHCCPTIHTKARFVLRHNKIVDY